MVMDGAVGRRSPRVGLLAPWHSRRGGSVDARPDVMSSGHDPLSLEFGVRLGDRMGVDM
jgi:hypothetical protein